MAGKRYGDPTYSFRMPRTLMEALREEAAKQNVTVSDILRELAVTMLTRKGYTLTEQPIEGQMQIDA